MRHQVRALSPSPWLVLSLDMIWLQCVLLWVACLLCDSSMMLTLLVVCSLFGSNSCLLVDGTFRLFLVFRNCEYSRFGGWHTVWSDTKCIRLKSSLAFPIRLIPFYSCSLCWWLQWLWIHLLLSQSSKCIAIYLTVVLICFSLMTSGFNCTVANCSFFGISSDLLWFAN